MLIFWIGLYFLIGMFIAGVARSIYIKLTFEESVPICIFWPIVLTITLVIIVSMAFYELGRWVGKWNKNE